MNRHDLPKDYVPALRFSWLTAIYDPVVRWTTRESAFKDMLVEQADIGVDMTVLDLASGSGTLAILVKQKFPSVDVVGVDGDPKIIEIAESKSRRANIPVSFDHGVATSLPYADASFDRVLSTLFFHHLTCDAKSLALSEVHRVLKPGGQLHIADWGKPTGIVMRLLFYPIQWLDGFVTTQGNVDGRLPKLMETARFEQVRTQKSINTLFGTLALYRATKI